MSFGSIKDELIFLQSIRHPKFKFDFSHQLSRLKEVLEPATQARNPDITILKINEPIIEGFNEGDNEEDNEENDIIKFVKELNLNSLQQEIKNSKVSTLTLGDKRLISIGRALIGASSSSNSSIIIAEDPFLDLDFFQLERIVRLFKQLVASGDSLLLSLERSSLNIELVQSIVDEVSLVSQGRILYSGAADSIDTYFESIGFPCPPGIHPLAYYQDLVKVETTSPTTTQASIERIKHLADRFETLSSKYFHQSASGSIGRPGSAFSSSTFITRKLRPIKQTISLWTLYSILLSDHFRQRRTLTASGLQRILSEPIYFIAKKIKNPFRHPRSMVNDPLPTVKFSQKSIKNLLCRSLRGFRNSVARFTSRGFCILQRCRLLFLRASTQISKDFHSNMIRLGSAVGIPLLLGATFFRLDNSIETVSLRLSSIHSFTMLVALPAYFLSLWRFWEEKIGYLSDIQQNFYSTPNLVISKAMAELPYISIFASLTSLVVHQLLGTQPRLPIKQSQYMRVAMLETVCMHSFAQLICTVAPTQQVRDSLTFLFAILFGLASSLSSHMNSSPLTSLLSKVLKPHNP